MNAAGRGGPGRPRSQGRGRGRCALPRVQSNVVNKFKKTPYTVGAHDLIHRPGEMREYELEIVVPEKLGEGLVAAQKDSILDVDLRMEGLHDGILASVHVSGTADGVCGRCLTDIHLPVEVEFQDVFAYSLDEAFDYSVLDDHVDLEPLIRDAVVLSLPFQPVCRPDCPGLDPETGEKLADQPHGEPQQVTDPRWAALAGFEPEAKTETTTD
ncbi:conserved protein of unknown function [Agreia sp. COWG]|nr:conserved protein of unknown function [Agreia sp. COWG]